MFDRRIPRSRATAREAGGDGKDRAERFNKHNNNGTDRKRGFEGRDQRQSWKRDRGRGTGANATGVSGRERWTRSRGDEAGDLMERGLTVQEEEGEEGEVRSDGDEEMGAQEEGEVQEGLIGESRPTGGLVDYGSSDESD
jgi:hypothetical protein